MPTLPPTFVSLDSDDELFHHPAVVADVADSLSSPTPDPDLDDGVLVSVVTGDGVGAITSPDSLAHSVAAKPTSLKPRLDLSDLSLHSPSSILGTPFDVSPRFEYPFPPSSSSAEPDALPTSLNPITSPFLAPFPAVFLPTLPSSMPFSRPEARCHSPTHPKLQPRDPPVPPTLAKKRWSNTISGPLFSHDARPSHSRKRSRSTVSLKTVADAADDYCGAPDVWGAAGSQAPSEAGDATSSRRASLPTRRRLGKEPEVPPPSSRPGSRGRDAPLATTETSSEAQNSSLSNIVVGQVPRSYPHNAPTTAHDTPGAAQDPVQ